MPTADERAVELRRFFPDRVVAAILGVDQSEIAELAVDPSDEVEGIESGGGDPDPDATAIIHFTGDWQQNADYTPSGFGLKAALGSDLKLYLAIGATDPDVNPTDVAADGLAGNWLPFAPAAAAAGGFTFEGEWSAGDYAAGTVVTYGATTYVASADADSSDEPGVSGAPLLDGDTIPTTWAEAGEFQFDTTDGDIPAPESELQEKLSTIFYFPATHAGHFQIALDTFDDHYISYYLYNEDLELQGSGSGDTTIGGDLDSAGDWYLQLLHDPGFDSGHDAGPVTANLVLSSGLTLQAAPEANPWQAFAQAPA